MRILLLGDASGFHATLGKALQLLGHDVTIASNGSNWMDTPRDVDLTRAPGKIGTLKYVFKLMCEVPKMGGYDIVQVHSPCFLELRPHRIQKYFDYICQNNRRVVYEALGTDVNYVRACLKPTMFKYSDFRVGGAPSPYAYAHPNEEQEWMATELTDFTRQFIDRVDGVIACLYEYYKVYEEICPEKLAYGGIPIDMSMANNELITEAPEKVRFMVGVQKGRRRLKGLERILPMLHKIVKERKSEASMTEVRNLSYNKYCELLTHYNVIVDQLYSYTPATNALLGMARGLVAVSGGADEYYDFIGEHENRPIVDMQPYPKEDIAEKIHYIIDNRERLPEWSAQCREFVRKHNDSLLVAQRHIDFWTKLLEQHD